MDRRKALIREYKENQPPAGIFQIKNLTNSKVFIGKGLNVQGKINGNQMQLKLGTHRTKALQEDWNTYGSEQFSFEVLDYLEDDGGPFRNQQKELAALEEMWLERLQPYGEKGYNRKPRKQVKS